MTRAPEKQKKKVASKSPSGNSGRKPSPGSARTPIRLPPMGAHMSVAGGVDRALDRARDAGCTALQIFLKNNNQWRAKPLDEAVIERFRAEIAKGDLGKPIAHASYLLNLASPKKDLVAKSMANLLDDLDRADRLGVVGIVLHPGAHVGRGEKTAVRQIARQINIVLDRAGDNPTAVYLESTAGQSPSIGHRLEHLGTISAYVRNKDR